MEFKVGDRVRVTQKFYLGLHNSRTKKELKNIGVVDLIGSTLLLVKFSTDYKYWLFESNVEPAVEIGQQLEFDFMNKEL